MTTMTVSLVVWKSNLPNANSVLSLRASLGHSGYAERPSLLHDLMYELERIFETSCLHVSGTPGD
jgi:hypothetical protein